MNFRRFGLLLALCVFGTSSGLYAQAAASVLKTVGTDPESACSGNQTILSVPAGTTVFYCYTIENLTNSTFLYNLTDNRLGSLATLRPVNALATDQIIANTTFAGPGNVTNTAQWTSPGGPLSSGPVIVFAAANIGVPALSDAALIGLGVLLVSAGFVLTRHSNQ
jgi:hypothetical protein